jgi:hypothetical protein
MMSDTVNGENGLTTIVTIAIAASEVIVMNVSIAGGAGTDIVTVSDTIGLSTSVDNVSTCTAIEVDTIGDAMNTAMTDWITRLNRSTLH